MSLSKAAELDAADVLGRFYKKFYTDSSDTIYLDGNSLGKLPLSTRDRITQVLNDEWGGQLIEGWNNGWYDMPVNTGNKIGRLLGAEEGTVIVSDSTSLNLYKLLYGILNSDSNKNEVVSDELNFPTDLYMVQGLLKQFGSEFSLKLAKSHDSISVDISEIKSLITDRTAVIVLSHVAFKSSYLYQIKDINSMAHEMGIKVLWDLSHSAGVIPIDLQDAGVDFAIGCTYKYLNGGPGAPAFLYVRKDLLPELESPVWGWFGAEKPFDFSLDYKPSNTIRKFLVGTPPILSLAAIESGVDLIIEAGIKDIRKKSVNQSKYLIELINEKLIKYGFMIGSPINPEYRGSHITLKHPFGRQLCKALQSDQGMGKRIITDFREPDNIRFGISPLYNSYVDLYETVEAIIKIINNVDLQDYYMNAEPVT